MTMVGNDEDYQYVLAMLLPYNMPWSEEEQGVSFWNWFERVFSRDDSWDLWNFMGEATGDQQAEYVTAYPTKANSHPLMKHQKGFDAEPPDTCPYHPSACVKLILRNVRSYRPDMPPLIWRNSPTLDKFWGAVQTPWLPGLSARRDSMMRSHPDTLAPGPAVVDSLRVIVETNLAKVRQELEATAGGKGSARQDREKKLQDREKKLQQCTNLICMQKLLTWRTDPPGEQQKSTLWNPADPRRNLLTAGDIGISQCSCARGARFHWHLSEGCLGGFFAFSPTTYFERLEQVIPALLHAAKGRLLSSLRASPVYYDSLLRVTADTDAPEYLRVVATYSNFRTADQAGQRSSDTDEHGTDKHRVIWLLSLPEMKELVEGPARPAEGAAEEHGGSAKRTALGDTSLWEKGALHVIASAPKSNNYSWRMTIAPAAEKGGEYFGIVLDWCGDQLFQHAALLKAAREKNVLGVITPLFRILEPQPAPRPGHNNVFVGLLSKAAVEEMEERRGVRLSDDQRRVLQDINTSSSGVQTIAAHAGTGKTLLSGFLLEALSPSILGTNFSVLILTPGRCLRDELVESDDCVGPFAAQGQVLWLGRPAAGKDSDCLWENFIGEKVEEELTHEKDDLNRIGETMKQPHRRLMQLNLPWKEILDGGDISVAEGRDIRAEDICAELAFFKRAAQSHMVQLIMTITRARAKIIRRLLAKVHVFVSTCDAWCKWLAGSMKGTMATALQQRPPLVVIMDEMEHYSVEQVIAATAGQSSIQTLVLIGDKHQRLKVRNPKYPRTPWVSSADGVMQEVEERRARVELDDEGDGEDDTVRGPSPGASSPGASSAASARELRNPAERFFSEWIEKFPAHRLTVSKRCGKQVTTFVSETFDFARDFTSSGDQNTWLWFVFYDGNGWSHTPFGYHGREDWKRRRRLDDLGWHHSLYGTLLLMCMKDLDWVQNNVPKSKQTNPPVAIAVPLERVGRPLAVLCDELFGDKVKVFTHHSIRGLSVNVVHGLRHRRWIDAEDQFAGVQEDPERDYMVQTRGKDKTVMWLEVQPYGTPKRQPEGPAQAPDPRLEGKDHKGSKSSKGSKGKEEGTSKQKTYAMRVNKVIETQQIWWFDLGVSVPNPCFDWAVKFPSLFPFLSVEQHQVQSVDHALYRCWGKMVSGEAEVPKEWEKKKQQFQDATAVLQAIVTCTDAASERGEAGRMKAFAIARLATLRDVGHGRAMKTYGVALPEDPRVDPKKPEHVGLALGFGIVLAPCAVVELSEDPRGGLTRVALPFLSMGNMSDPEPMLRALGVVVWHLARAVFPEKLKGCDLTTIAHKTEIKEDHGALWFNKSCASSRLATCILDPARARGKKKQWYAYLGGGAVDVDQSELLAGGVVLCKDWAWAELTLLAAWLLLCTCPCGTPDLLCDPRLIFTAHDDEGVKEAENPLLDDEEEKEKDEVLLGTASPDQGLLDGGAPLDDELLAPLLAPYEGAENEVSEHGDAAPGARRDRPQFVRSCVRVQAIFLRDHLPGWPWRPGAQERTDPASPRRAEKGRQSAEAFRKWMGSSRTAEAAREDRGA